MSAAEAVVEVKGIRMSFRGKKIYHDLDLSVLRGETLTVVGPSGVGKSVLLKLLIGLHKPRAGKILIEGTDIVPLSERQLRSVRRKVGMLFQNAALFDSLDVGENIAYGIHEHFGWDDDKIQQRVAECLEWVGLPGIESRLPANLSGGMKKRVGLARALAAGPEVILYDEPTTGLDPANARRINDLIVSLKDRLGVTSIVITHDIESAFAVSDRIGLVQDQRIDLVIDAELARNDPPPELKSFLEGEEQQV